MKITIHLSILVACVIGGWLRAPQATAAALTGTQTTAPAAVNLTSEGTLDWAHWGLTAENDFDQKSGGTNQISNVTTTGNANQFEDALTGFSWTDGDPTPTVAFTTTGIFIEGLSQNPNRTNGFQFTVAANATLKLLKVYAGSWNARIRFEARLSDGSAPAYIDESLDDFGAGAVAVYSVRFAANSPGQTLIVRVYATALHDPNGNCTLLSASLGTPFSGAGTLTSRGTFLGNGEVVDLTGEGILDWGHWGEFNEFDFNHKAGVTQRISDVTPVGSSALAQIGTIPAVYRWSDGTPTVASSNSFGISVTGERNGFQFTVPADGTTNVLRVYVNAASARVLFEALLSDGSAPPVYDGSFASPEQQGPVMVYTVTFAAASAGQTLTVRCTLLADEGTGWISLQAATLRPLPSQTGILGGGHTVLAVASVVDLTEEGRIDWAHWGLDVPTDIDRKAGATNVIGDFGLIGLAIGGGPLQVLQFDDNFTGYSWSDGTPTLTANNSGSGIYLGQGGEGPGLNTGFTISVPADTTIRALKVYVGAYGSRMHFEAALSDGSAPAFVDESFANPSDGPNRVYTLTFAAASPGQKLIVRYWIISLIDPAGNITLQSAVVRGAAPTVSLQTPANGSIFHPANGGLRFTASTIDPFSIAPGQLGLELNGTVLSSSLVVTGTPTFRSAVYTNLAPNQFYEGRIWAVDNLGNGGTNFVRFDTFSTNGVVVIEAEDYNYNAGHFINNPAPGAYTNLTAVFEIDHNFSGVSEGEYRPNDPIQIEVAAETRPYFINAGVNNYVVAGWNPASWLNFTRNFSNVEYLVYVRYGATADQTLELDLVTSDATQTGQTFSQLGTLDTPRTPNENAYAYAPLTDGSGNVLSVALSGEQTIRLTGMDVSPQAGLVTDFIMLVPTEARPRLNIVLAGGQVTISFPTRAGRTYTVQYKNSLSDPSWQNAPSVNGDGTTHSITQPATEQARFYRLSVQ